MKAEAGGVGGGRRRWKWIVEWNEEVEVGSGGGCGSLGWKVVLEAGVASERGSGGGSSGWDMRSGRWEWKT